MITRTAVTTIVVGFASVALAQASANKPVVVKNGSYRGQTSEKIAITFQIANRKIRNLSTQIGYSGACGQGGGPGYTITGGSIAIGKNGQFHATVTLVGPVKSVANVKGALTGSASGGTVKGKIVDLALAKQKCNGYVETFTAHRL